MSFKCIFCNETKGVMNMFRSKDVCNDCLDEVFNYSKYRAVSKKLKGLFDRIEKVIEEE